MDVIIRKRDMLHVHVTKAMRLIIAKFRLQMQPKRRLQGVKAPKCLNVKKIKADIIKQSFVATLKEHQEPIVLGNQVVEAAWCVLRVIKHLRDYLLFLLCPRVA